MISQVVCVGRNAPQYESRKIEFLKADFDEPLILEGEIKRKHHQFDLGFCALGTTIKTAGNRANFRKVDFDYVIHFARACKNLGVTRFGVVSSTGADLNSWAFYLRIKGEMEEALKSMGFEHLVIARPSLLLGQRGEFRLGEVIIQTLHPVTKWLYRGPFAGIQPVLASDVAIKLFERTIRSPSHLEYLSDFTDPTHT
jgi:uncharacterized protein YbjT (DUF2867 family)